MRPRWVWAYVVVGLAASVLHWRAPSADVRALGWDLLAAIAVAGAWIGIARNRPSPALPWRLLATGLTLLACGDVIWDVTVHVLGRPGPEVPWSDIVYLSAYPFLVAGLLLLARSRAPAREVLVDGAVISLAIAAPLWQLVIRPTIESTSSGTAFDRAVTVAYPLLDCVLLVAVAYLAFTMRRWNPSAALLLGGLLATTAGDIVYARVSSLGLLDSTLWLDTIWPASYTLLAAAMLHPSMRELGRPSAADPDRVERVRVRLLALSMLTLPVLLGALEVGADGAHGVTILATFVIGVAALVSWRLLRLMAENTRARADLAAREARFAAFVEHASDVIAVGDEQGKFVYVSPAVERMLGRPADRFLGTTVFDYLHPDDRAFVATFLEAVAAAPGIAAVAEARARHADGRWRWLEATITNQIHEPSIRGYVSNLRDITDRKRGETVDRAVTDALEATARGAPLRATLSDLLRAVGSELTTGRCALQLTDPEGQGHDKVIVPVSESAARWCVPIVASDDRRVGAITVHHDDERSPDATDIDLVAQIAAVAAVAVDRAAAEDMLEHQAFHDSLTGLPNRALLIDRLGQALLRLARTTGDVAVLFIDLDRFKVINDSLGHDAGDELLVEVARRLESALQAADTVARFGGDEFVVVCERLHGESDARIVAERLTRALSEPVALSQGGVVTATASIGIALARGSHERPEELLRDADAAMYRAKERGRARTEVFDVTLRSDVVVRLETERALRRALEHDELRVLYQPAIRLADGNVVGAEALLRWRHRSRGLLGPAEFVPVAEETGLIVPIGDWVVEQACAELAHQQLVRPEAALVLSVNLSGRQLVLPDLVDRIAARLDAAAVPAEQLCLEVTESVLLDDVELTVAALSGLKDLGTRLAVDDFGTGYSSLGYLKQFPFDVLKIDRAFVAGLGTCDADDAIVRAAVDMAHALGMEVLAEGVETERQRARARDLGCDLAQGFFFAMPATAEETLGRHELRVVGE